MPDITNETGQPDPDEIRRGFFVVVSKSGSRIWLGESLREAASNLDAVIAKNLENDDTWWIDYCLGSDSQGRMAWMGTDQASIVFEMQTVLRLIGKN